MCFCAGLASEAVALLQEGHLWRYASTLAAHRLQGGQQAAALERWAAHIHQVGSRLPDPAVGFIKCSAAHSHLMGADWGVLCRSCSQLGVELSFNTS